MMDAFEACLLALLYAPQVVRAAAEKALEGDVEAARLVLEVAGLLPVDEGGECFAEEGADCPS